MSVPPFSVTAGLATLHYNKLGWKSLSLTLCVCARVGRACDLININKAAYGINRPVFVHMEVQGERSSPTDPSADWQAEWKMVADALIV